MIHHLIDTSDGLFDSVRPKTGVLARSIASIETSRKFKWRAYYRACKRIPEGSPVRGCTSWRTINERRHQLIDDEIDRGDDEMSDELKALQAICDEIGNGPMIVNLFLLARVIRRLKAKLP